MLIANTFLAGASERGGPWCDLGLGRSSLHHRKGQNHREARQDEDGLIKYFIYVAG